MTIETDEIIEEFKQQEYLHYRKKEKVNYDTVIDEGTNYHGLDKIFNDDGEVEF